MRVFVSVSVSVCVRVRACMHARMRACVCVWVCVCVRARAAAFLHAMGSCLTNFNKDTHLHHTRTCTYVHLNMHSPSFSTPTPRNTKLGAWVRKLEAGVGFKIRNGFANSLQAGVSGQRAGKQSQSFIFKLKKTAIDAISTCFSTCQQKTSKNVTQAIVPVKKPKKIGTLYKDLQRVPNFLEPFLRSPGGSKIFDMFLAKRTVFHTKNCQFHRF